MNNISVREFVTIAAKHCAVEVDWQGQGVEEKGINKETGEVIVEIDPRYYRPAEVETLLGDASKAKEKLGWEPKIKFAQLVEEMITEDLKLASRDSLVEKVGYKVFKHHE